MACGGWSCIDLVVDATNRSRESLVLVSTAVPVTVAPDPIDSTNGRRKTSPGVVMQVTAYKANAQEGRGRLFAASLSGKCPDDIIMSQRPKEKEGI